MAKYTAINCYNNENQQFDQVYFKTLTSAIIIGNGNTIDKELESIRRYVEDNILILKQGINMLSEEIRLAVNE